MIFSFLTSSNDLHPSKYFTLNDLTNGLPPLILCCEMAVIAPFFYLAYPVGPYKIGNGLFYDNGARVQDTRTYQGGPLGFFGILKAMNVFDMVLEFSRGLPGNIGRRSAGAPVYEDSQSYDPSPSYEQPQPMQSTKHSRGGRHSRYANERY
jgi:hypothetical protein